MWTLYRQTNDKFVVSMTCWCCAGLLNSEKVTSGQTGPKILVRQNHSLDVHFKRDSGGTAGFHHQQSVDRKDIHKRKQGLNLFERFRISKQDKIAANVAQHIRAVRAAEALDRQTARVRRRNSSKLIPQRSSSSGEDETVGSDARKMRLVTMLKQAYGNDVEKVPGFIEFAESAKEDCRRSYVDAAAQTSYDLLETWFPALRKRIAQSEQLINNSEDQDTPSLTKSNQKHTQSKFNQFHQQKHLGFTSLSSRSSPQASINHAFDEENSKELEKEEREKFMLKSSLQSTSDTRNGNNSLEMEYIMRKLNDSDSHRNELRDMSTTNQNKYSSEYKHPIDAENSLTASKIHTSSPKYVHKTINKTMSSDESLLSGAGSLVIEESASSGGESSPGSGIYKNIIINLGGIIPQSDYNNLSTQLVSGSTDRLQSLPERIRNIESPSHTPQIKPKKHS